ncbi:hypothetical protein H5410_002472 [Solanum commersonii]|uniref:Uncharacterized protein n=1 Tax=Solanum commersonii TaxID=4109 RepID=A0A9J6B2D5_SOLCO|nr:hypothetical protein H5410_002472 [Solanum commersonii]
MFHLGVAGIYVNKANFFEIISKQFVYNKYPYPKAKDKFEPQMDFDVVKVSEMDFFNIMVKSSRP